MAAVSRLSLSATPGRAYGTFTAAEPASTNGLIFDPVFSSCRQPVTTNIDAYLSVIFGWWAWA